MAQVVKKKCFPTQHVVKKYPKYFFRFKVTKGGTTAIYTVCKRKLVLALRKAGTYLCENDLNNIFSEFKMDSSSPRDNHLIHLLFGERLSIPCPEDHHGINGECLDWISNNTIETKISKKFITLYTFVLDPCKINMS